MKAMHPPSAARPPQRGLALIVAMLVAALAAAVAISVATAQSQWLAQVEHRRDQVEAQSIATAGIAWARAIVEADAPGIDHLGEPWALPLPPTPVENGDVQGRIVDAQSMLNVNTLGSAQHASAAQQRFARLFAALAIPAPALASLTDWLDADDAAGNGGAEDAWYMAQDEPSLAANGAATRFEELSAIRGMTPQTMERLAPFVTALPGDAPVNVNTAPSAVLSALLDGIDPAALATLVADRRLHPFARVEDFRNRLPPGVSIIDPALVSVDTHYFLVFVRARQGETIANARALIQRDASTSSVVWQTVE
ncbi:MAG TPA: type II secretion system minor pseudopilin GspK [Casimicrobiaceae bacterium]|jgi:general secretion pathway protein K|nr:type II secretion system minor pseudopilin GspK [Casimicrobiaceae bacterium]